MDCPILLKLWQKSNFHQFPHSSEGFEEDFFRRLVMIHFEGILFHEMLVVFFNQNIL